MSQTARILETDHYQDEALEHLPQELNLPIILAGYTGAGKDTVSNAAMNIADTTASRHFFQHSASRYTDRPARPGEIHGMHGHFISPRAFEDHKNDGDFLYHYQKDAYGGTRYGFSKSILLSELCSRHTFVVGGEIDTSLGLKQALDHIATDTKQRARNVMDQFNEWARSENGNVVKLKGNNLDHILHPVILFVNRPPEKIIEGIKHRPAPDQEKTKRIAHIQNTWERIPERLQNASGGVELIWNEDVDAAALQIINFVEAEVARQMKETYGSKAR